MIMFSFLLSLLYNVILNIAIFVKIILRTHQRMISIGTLITIDIFTI